MGNKQGGKSEDDGNMDIVRDITEATKNLNISNVAKWMEKVSHY